MITAMNLNIQLPKFEGPLALLLYLIRKEEMDIFDIEINKITAQYLDYIRQMKEFNLEGAGEFIAMAATLIHIKSRMLLPTYNDQGEIVETEDPRKQLVQRLLEYQKYQEAAKLLYERPLVGRDIWARGMIEAFDNSREEIEIEDNALFALISAYRRAVKAAQKRYHRVAAKTQSIASRILEIKDRLIPSRRVALSELIDAIEERRRQVLITFLSALELAKMGLVRLFQTDAYQEIYMEASQPIEAAAISNIEEYEHLIEEETPQLGFDLAAATEEPAPTAPVEENLFDETEEAAPSASMDFIEEEIPAEEMATDEEIAAAEAEWLGIGGMERASEEVAQVEPTVEEEPAVPSEGESDVNG